MKIDGRSTTRATETYTALRALILSGSMAPGLKIRTMDLRKRFDASLSTVREAISQLLAEGLVVSQAHRGFTVSPVSVGELQDLTRVRIDIESLCISSALKYGDVQWESRVIAAAHRLAKTERSLEGRAPNANWNEQHDQFHHALVSSCDSPLLLRFRQQLYEKAERYRKLELALPSSRNPDKEHAAIVKAVLVRDVVRATELITDHISLTCANILRGMSRATKDRAGHLNHE